KTARIDAFALSGVFRRMEGVLGHARDLVADAARRQSLALGFAHRLVGEMRGDFLALFHHLAAALLRLVLEPIGLTPDRAVFHSRARNREACEEPCSEGRHADGEGFLVESMVEPFAA